MKEISTQLEEISLSTIRKNYLKKSFWSKQWLLVDMQDLQILWRLKCINIKENKIETEFYVGKFFDYESYDLLWKSRTLCIPLEHEEYSEELFQKQMFQNIVYLIESLETMYILETDDVYKVYCKQLNSIKLSVHKALVAALKERKLSTRLANDITIDVSDYGDNVAYRYLRIKEHQVLDNIYKYVYSTFGKEYETPEVSEYFIEEYNKEVANLNKAINGGVDFKKVVNEVLDSESDGD